MSAVVMVMVGRGNGKAIEGGEKADVLQVPHVVL